MAHCRDERSHKCRLSIRNSTPCSLGVMGYSCGDLHHLQIAHADLEAAGDAGRALVGADRAGDDEARFLRQVPRLLEYFRRDVLLEDHGLRDAGAVADLQELQLALVGLVVQPALKVTVCPTYCAMFSSRMIMGNRLRVNSQTRRPDRWLTAWLHFEHLASHLSGLGSEVRSRGILPQVKDEGGGMKDEG